MRHFVLVLAAATLSFAASAQTTTDTQSSIQVPAPKSQPNYRMWPEQYEDYKRIYDLSNGQTLALTSYGKAMYAQISGETKRRIWATARGSFVAGDQSLSMHIDLDGTGEASGQVAYLPQAGANALSSTEPVRMTLAARQAR